MDLIQIGYLLTMIHGETRNRELCCSQMSFVDPWYNGLTLSPCAGVTGVHRVRDLILVL